MPGVGTVGGAGAAFDAWSAPPPETTPGVPDRDPRCDDPEIALEVLILQDAEHAEAGIRVTQERLRQLCERRAAARAEIRRLMQAIAEARRNGGFWSRLVDGLGWVGKALGAVGAIAGVAGTGGGLALAAGVGAAVTGAGSALARIGVGVADREAGHALSEAEAQRGIDADAEAENRRLVAFAGAVMDAEAALRERAVQAVETERRGRETAASLGRDVAR